VDGTELLARLLHPDAFADGTATREWHRVMGATVRSGR